MIRATVEQLEVAFVSRVIGSVTTCIAAFMSHRDVLFASENTLAAEIQKLFLLQRPQ